jgi:hypothetical protein
VTTVTPLRALLADWTDWDVAEYQLGAVLGLWPEWADETMWDDFDGNDVKGVMWSNNPVGNMLHATIRKLVELGVLESKDDGEFVRATATPVPALAWPEETPT